MRKKSLLILHLITFILIQGLILTSLAYAYPITMLSPTTQIDNNIFSENFVSKYSLTENKQQINTSLNTSNNSVSAQKSRVLRESPEVPLTRKIAAYITGLTVFALFSFFGSMYIYYTFFYNKTFSLFSLEALNLSVYLLGVGTLGLVATKNLITFGNHGSSLKILSYRELDGVKLIITKKATLHPWGNPELHVEIDKQLSSRQRIKLLAYLAKNELPSMLEELYEQGYSTLDIVSPIKIFSRFLKEFALASSNANLISTQNLSLKISYNERSEGILRALLTWLSVKLYYGLRNNQLNSPSNIKIQSLTLKRKPLQDHLPAISNSAININTPLPLSIDNSSQVKKNLFDKFTMNIFKRKASQNILIEQAI